MSQEIFTWWINELMIIAYWLVSEVNGVKTVI